ncbi:hypothetical protein E5C26_01665 [Serratia proteamaculans]|uniref:hypothetical protein n=1 Tax=Serratia proteamaculans TaxID=28151 RepID=UPI0010763B27|nr:hypothetical protein [Serratia proteamaculans]TFZ53063.1 hypothetical protein E5C26_01665 [Serratia proteamaculans]
MSPTSLRVAFLLLLLPLSGCQSTQRTSALTKATVVAAPSDAEIKAARLQQCHKNLEVLTKLNDVQHAAIKQEFDRVMKGAAQYSGLRPQVTDDTQNTVDALYRYRVNLLCSKINQDVLNALAERGEPKE